MIFSLHCLLFYYVAAVRVKNTILPRWQKAAIVEEGKIKDCFQPLHVTGTGAAPPPPTIGTTVDNTNAAEDSTTQRLHLLRLKFIITTRYAMSMKKGSNFSGDEGFKRLFKAFNKLCRS
jgi:hypothetical protein